MIFLRRVAFMAVACSWLFLVGCGDTFRPIAYILPQPAGNPQLADTVTVYNVNPDASNVAAVSIFNVSGDSNVGNYQVGANASLSTSQAIQTRLATYADSDAYVAVANPQADNITRIDPVTGATQTIGLPQGFQPGFITATATTAQILVSLQPAGSTACSGKGAVGIVDVVAGALTNTVCVGSMPGFIQVAQNDATAFVLDETDNTVTGINIASATLSTATPLAVGTDPIWATLSPDGSTLYVLNQGSSSISVINAVGQTVTNPSATLAHPLSSPSMILADSNLNRLYVSNTGNNTVSILTVGTLAEVHDPIAVGTSPVDLAVTSDGTTVYVANTGSDFVSAINTGSFNVTTITPDPAATVQAVAVSKDGTKAFVGVTVPGDLANANLTSGNGVYVILTSNNQLVTNESNGFLNVAPPQDLSCDVNETCASALLQRPVEIVPRM